MSISVRDLLIEKYINFLNFIKDKVPVEHQTKFDLYKSTPVEGIIMYIRTQIAPLRYDKSLLIIKIASANNVPIDNLTDEDKTKIGRYIDFFSDLLIKIDQN